MDDTAVDQSTQGVGEGIAQGHDGYINLQIPLPPMPLGYSYHRRAFIVNELLCYLQNKLDTSFKILVKIVTDFYDQKDISAAKKLLFDNVKSSDPRLRYRQCRGDNRSRQDVRDMIWLLLSAELTDTPIFLALDISRFPPLTGESQDMSSMLNSMEDMRNTLTLLTSSQKDLADSQAQLSKYVHTNVVEASEHVPAEDQ
jgi:hypothetical protein